MVEKLGSVRGEGRVKSVEVYNINKNEDKDKDEKAKSHISLKENSGKQCT